ncbi:unnamed protein product, partial [marine sediment metagenome]
KERLEKEFLPLPKVGNVTGLGLLWSIEIVADKETRRSFPPEANIIKTIIARCWEKGLFIRGGTQYGADQIYIIPPLIITKEEVDKELDILYSIIRDI